MAGTLVGATKAAAKIIGVPFELYIRQLAAGRKWCFRCRRWLAKSKFGRDATRGDGVASSCLSCRRAQQVRRRAGQ